MNELSPSTFLKALANELDVLSSFQTITGWVADDFQKQLLTIGPEEPIIACLAGRGSGKSLTIACRAVYHANTTRDAVVLCLSASVKQCLELFRTIKLAHSKLPLAHMITRETAQIIQLQNGSRIICVSASESSSRGWRATLILADEADLSAMFGNGYSLKSVTLEITEERQTDGRVAEVLPWICNKSVMDNPGWKKLPVFTRKILGRLVTDCDP